MLQSDHDRKFSLLSCNYCLVKHLRLLRHSHLFFKTNKLFKSFNSLDDFQNCQSRLLINTIVRGFVFKDYNMFKKGLSLRQQYRANISDAFEKFGKDTLFKMKYFAPNSNFTRKQRIDFVCQIYDCNAYYNQDSKVAQILETEECVAIIGNMLMSKECNNIKCKRKNTRLKRCKMCVSFYYCSRLCQKKDWLSHRKVCKKLRSRDYSMSYNSEF